MSTLTMHEYSFATPGDLGGQGNYRRFCRAAGLHMISGGWGLAHCTDNDGQRWTAVTSDVDWLRMFVSAGEPFDGVTIDGTPRPAVQLDFEVPEDVLLAKFGERRGGWPDDWV